MRLTDDRLRWRPRSLMILSLEVLKLRRLKEANGICPELVTNTWYILTAKHCVLLDRDKLMLKQFLNFKSGNTS